MKRFQFISLLRPHWKTLSLAFVAVIFESITDLLDPWPLKLVFDFVLGTKPLTGWLATVTAATVGTGKSAMLLFAAAAVIVIAVFGAASSYSEKYLTTSVGQWVMHDLRKTLYHHIQRLSLAYHDHKSSGDLISTVTSDIDAIQNVISNVLLGLVVNILTLCGMIGVMFYLNWRFTILAMCVIPPLCFVVYTFTRQIKDASRAVRKKEGEVVSVLEEVLTSIRVVQAFTREDFEQERFERQSQASVQTALRARGLKARLAPLVEIIVAGGTCVVLWYGTHLVVLGKLSAGALLVFLIYLGKMFKPIKELSKMTDTVSKAWVGYERIKSVLDTERQVRNLPGAKRAPAFIGDIEFENVSFSYDNGMPILDGLSLHIKPGQVAALVGPTGAGKTTIISLIPRFYEIKGGKILVDGTDIGKFKLKSLRQQISFVLQESILFRAPIWQNIAYGRPEASRQEVIEAAKLANAHEFIQKLPEGYDTMVGERGVTLSGGQRQRIAIARAIIRRAPILILDEPSSGLDAASEEVVFEALGRLMEGKTSIVVAHRLATIRRADIIFVIEKGKCAESGTHEELLARGGLYSKFYEIQFRSQEEKEKEDWVGKGGEVVVE